jgi:hypothetical protein
MFGSIVLSATLALATPIAAQTQPPSQTAQPPAPPTAVGTSGTVPPASPSIAGPDVTTTPAVQTVRPCAPADMSTSIALLDRMTRILADATKDSLGKVTIDRSAIDELRAEVAQIRATLQPASTPPR